MVTVACLEPGLEPGLEIGASQSCVVENARESEKPTSVYTGVNLLYQVKGECMEKQVVEMTKEQRERVVRLWAWDFYNRPFNDGAVEYLRRKAHLADRRSNRRQNWESALLSVIYGGTMILIFVSIFYVVKHMGGR